MIALYKTAVSDPCISKVNVGTMICPNVGSIIICTEVSYMYGNSKYLHEVDR